jgi:hypothetical protein
MSWCEDNRVDYVFGFARNQRLHTIIAEALVEAARRWEQTQKPARVFVEFPYQTTTGSWNHPRRVVAKAEHIDGKENPRYVVTSLAAEAWPSQKLYEELYCGRGDMENRIKEQFTLFAESCQRRNHARQPTPFVLFRDGVPAGVWTAEAGPESHRVGHCASGHDSVAPAQNRCAGAHHGAPHLHLVTAQLSLAGSICRRAPSPDRINKTVFDV